jgi:hypothetical protein
LVREARAGPRAGRSRLAAAGHGRAGVAHRGRLRRVHRAAVGRPAVGRQGRSGRGRRGPGDRSPAAAHDPHPAVRAVAARPLGPRGRPGGGPDVPRPAGAAVRSVRRAGAGARGVRRPRHRVRHPHRDRKRGRRRAGTPVAAGRGRRPVRARCRRAEPGDPARQRRARGVGGVRLGVRPGCDVAAGHPGGPAPGQGTEPQGEWPRREGDGAPPPRADAAQGPGPGRPAGRGAVRGHPVRRRDHDLPAAGGDLGVAGLVGAVRHRRGGRTEPLVDRACRRPHRRRPADGPPTRAHRRRAGPHRAVGGAGRAAVAPAARHGGGRVRLRSAAERHARLRVRPGGAPTLRLRQRGLEHRVRLRDRPGLGDAGRAGGGGQLLHRLPGVGGRGRGVYSVVAAAGLSATMGR